MSEGTNELVDLLEAELRRRMVLHVQADEAVGRDSSLKSCRAGALDGGDGVSSREREDAEDAPRTTIGLAPMDFSAERADGGAGVRCTSKQLQGRCRSARRSVLWLDAIAALAGAQMLAQQAT